MKDVLSLKEKQIEIQKKIDRIVDSIKIFWYKYFLKKNYLKKSDYISVEYKSQIKQFFAPFCERRFDDFIWHEFYSSRNGIYKPQYIPDDIFCIKILPFFNNKEIGKAYADKNFLNKLFPNTKQAICIVRKINGEFYDENYNFISEGEASKICMQYNEVIIKPAMGSSGGRNVCFLNKEDFINIHQIFMEYEDDYVVQLPISQSEEMMKLNSTSVNTIRVMSLYLGGKTEILSSVVRMGNIGNRVDNLCQGGFSCGIDSKGKLKNVAFSTNGQKISIHPNGFDFKGFCIPNIDGIHRLVKKLAPLVPNERIISWDICLDENNSPILIEINTLGQEIVLHQLNNGPLFGRKTTEILSLVYSLSQ